MDSYIDMNAAKSILSSGFVGGDPNYLTGVADFPMIHIIGAQLCLVADIALISVAKWLPSFLDVALILFLYLFICKIFKNEKLAIFVHGSLGSVSGQNDVSKYRIALISALLFATVQNHILFSSLFIRETIALVLAVGSVYLYFSAEDSLHPVIYRTLSVVCLLGTVLLSIFLVINFLVVKASGWPFLRKTYFRDNYSGKRMASSFLLIVGVAILSYWMYLVYSPLHDLVTFLKEVFSPSLMGGPSYAESQGTANLPGTIRGSILFYGFYGLLLVFGLFLLSGLLPRLKLSRVESLSFALFLFFCGIIGLASLYFLSTDVGAYPDRFTTYGWLFAFAPLVAIILKKKPRWLMGFGVLLLFIFMLHNIYQIDPETWNPRSVTEVRPTTQEDYALTTTIDLSSGRVASHRYNLLAIYDAYNNPGEDIFGDVDLSTFDWIIVQKQALSLWEQSSASLSASVIAMEALEKGEITNRDNIYQSVNLSVFKFRQ
jgi:hypothetical protein